VPLWQLVEGPQVVPHAPQLLRSLCRTTHVLLQQVWPWPQLQPLLLLPAVHTESDEHFDTVLMMSRKSLQRVLSMDLRQLSNASPLTFPSQRSVGQVF
jgi:hypothetical protein